MYRFKVVLFDATCSLLMLSTALESHLNQYNSNIATDMKQNLYVDNLVLTQTGTHAIHYYKTARSNMNPAHFKPRAWASNSPQPHTSCLEEGTADPRLPLLFLASNRTL